VEAAKSVTNNKPLHLVVGGFHLLPAKSDEINRIANALRDTWKVEYVAPVHCTGEAAFGILKETFGDHYVYAGLSTTLVLGPKVAALGEDGKPQESAMDEKDLRGFHKLMLASNDNPERMLARHEDEHRVPALLAWTP
jgi:7,8-dihydropterin-6-yl-methyl-4-(beta-D-ribofuranosyl)aminobenzene 5'-phosphate synthase